MPEELKAEQTGGTGDGVGPSPLIKEVTITCKGGLDMRVTFQPDDPPTHVNFDNQSHGRCALLFSNEGTFHLQVLEIDEGPLPQPLLIRSSVPTLCKVVPMPRKDRNNDTITLP